MLACPRSSNVRLQGGRHRDLRIAGVPSPIISLVRSHKSRHLARTSVNRMLNFVCGTASQKLRSQVKGLERFVGSEAGAHGNEGPPSKQTVHT